MPDPRAVPQLAARLLLAAAALAAATACPPPPPPVDSTPPSPPSLSSGTITASSIQVRWTAVGDDGLDGTASAQELRYLSGPACPITQLNFSTGTPAAGLAVPQPPGNSESFTVNGLAGDSSFCFMLKVSDEAGNPAFSAALQASTADVVGPAQATLTASNVGDTSATLGWTAVGDNGATGTAASQELRYAAGGACPLTAANFSSATLVSGVPAPAAAGTAQSVDVTGLTPAAAYCFALRVADEAGNTSLSASVPVNTSDTVAPAAPALSASASTGTTVTLDWTAVGDDGNTGAATSYEMRSLSGAACPITQANFASGAPVTGLPAPSAAGTAESFTVTGLSSDTAYCFMLAVTDDAANTAYSNAASRSTLDVTAPASAALAAAPASGTSVTLTWTAVGDDGATGTAASYDLRYASGAACPLTQASFGAATQATGEPAPAAAGSAETFAVGGLTSETSYCFMLQVADEAGNTSLSNSAAATTPDVTAPAAAVLAAGVIGGTSVQVTWTAVGDDGATGTATSYDLRYQAGTCGAFDFGTATQVSGEPPPQGAGTPEALIVSGLGSDTAYCFMLQVADEAGNTSLSNALAATTPDVTAPASAALTTGTVSDTQVVLNWTAVGDDGATGTAASQEMRFLSGAQCPITAGNFNLGTVVSGLGPPAAAGTAETVTASGLQRQTQYCFALRVTDEAGNASISNSASATTPDTVPPDAPVAAIGTTAPRALEVRFNSVGDDGNLGTASSYDLRYLSGAACPVTAANFGGATQVTTPAPQPPGNVESVTVNGLAPATAYCFAVRVQDDAGNLSALSNSAAGTTDADVTPPGPVADLAVGLQTATSIELRWTAVADDGTTASSGPAASYELRYLAGAACPINPANFATGTLVAGLPAPGAPGSAESVTATALAPVETFCFLLRVADAASNASFSNAATGATLDLTPPAQVTDLAAAGPDSTGAVVLTWTAVGDDGNTGAAASYDLRYQAGACATFDFATATQIAGEPAPAVAGAAETFTVNGLSGLSQYCFGLQVADDIAQTSPVSNSAAAVPDPSAQMAQIRQHIHDAATSPVALSSVVRGAVVTYLKASVAGAPVGHVDGPGFFVQNGPSGPALLFAMDPTATLPGMAAGDVLDVSITEAQWLGCSAPPCTPDNSMYAVTQATVAPTASGATLPAAQNLLTTLVPVPIGAGPWNLEHERVSVDGGVIVGTFVPSGPGFQQIQLDAGVNHSPSFQLRVPDAVVDGRGLIPGCRVSVNGTPMWRTDGNAQVASWLPSEVTPAGCPAIAITGSNPVDAARDVPDTTTVAVSFNQPLVPATIVVQPASGACSGSVQMSGDQTFTNCVGLSSVAPSGANRTFTFTPAAPLAASTRYRVRAVTGVQSANGNTVGGQVATPNGFVTAGTAACSARPVVISQVYGGGGNAGAVWRQDFIELHNRTASPVSLAGMSVQYAGATGTGSWQVTNLTGTIAPYGYFLVQEAAGTGGTQDLPPADVTGVIAMGATAGKVAFVSNTTALNGACPSGPNVLDLVGYGITANCFIGAPALQLTNNTSVLREEQGCADTGNHYVDFAAVFPAPRNTANAPSPACPCP